MPEVLRQLVDADAPGFASLWQAATDQRRLEIGVRRIREHTFALDRPGVFGVGVIRDAELLSIALAMPARADDGRSLHNVPGLAHISSVATRPGAWRRGLGGRCVRAIMSQATRRGFARVQLWTHTSNAGARRLYEREGFEASGRSKIDDYGEWIVHYIRELPVPPWKPRQASRLVCLDPDERVLLMHWRDPLDGHQLWEPPGGGVEVGETTYDTVVREWLEETGLPLPRLAAEPTMVGRDVIFNGSRVVVDEAFYLGRAASAGTPSLDRATEEERATYLGHAWVPRHELGGLTDAVEPDLWPVLERLAPEGPGLEGRASPTSPGPEGPVSIGDSAAGSPYA